MSMEALEKVKHEIAKAEDRIRYYEQQDKIMRSEIRRLTRKERTHRLCTRGGLVGQMGNIRQRAQDVALSEQIYC